MFIGYEIVNIDIGKKVAPKRDLNSWTKTCCDKHEYLKG